VRGTANFRPENSHVNFDYQHILNSLSNLYRFAPLKRSSTSTEKPVGSQLDVVCLFTIVRLRSSAYRVLDFTLRIQIYVEEDSEIACTEHLFYLYQHLYLFYIYQT